MYFSNSIHNKLYTLTNKPYNTILNNRNMKIIDIHNHSLPGIDDGAQDIEMSIKMLNIAANSGTSDIVLTPHHLNGAFSNFTDSTIQKTAELQEHVDSLNIPVTLHYGAEVHLVPETVEQLVEKKALTYCGLGKAALIELPKNSIPAGTESILSELIYNGITPIIAHPERNSSLRRDYSQLEEWVEFGCKSQITGQSCTGSFGQTLQELSFELISKNLAHFIASDAHRPEGRSPNLQKTLEIINRTFNKEISKTLLHDNPLRLINGQNIESLNIKTPILATKKKPTRKKWLRFLN